jgi:broad specificity phosphatase PhoE
MTLFVPDTRFGIMRHGETEWNTEKRIQGQSDSPLTALGRETARRWAHWLAAGPWDRLLVSDLGRARETAAIINAQLKLPQTVDRRLREQNWGGWTARTIAELRRTGSGRLQRMEAMGWRFQPPDGESREAVWLRSSQTLADAARQWPGQSILVIAHGGVIKCLLYRLMGRRFLPSEPPVLLPRALHRLRHGTQGLAIEERNAVDLHSTEFLR